MQAGLVWTSSHRTSTGKFLGARSCMALSDRLNNTVRFRYRDPRWGRGQETPGEDIFRTSQYTKSLLMGLMGGDAPPFKSLPTCKHLAGYDVEQGTYYNRFGYNAFIGTQDLAEYYLPPFQQCARDSKVPSMMCSYNAINGIPACANNYLLNDIVRDHWNWVDRHQYVVSDCNAVLDIASLHNYTADTAEATAISIIEGTDNVCEVGHTTNQTAAYSRGLLKENTIDQALRRQYQGLITAGYFDPADQVPYRSLSWSDVNTAHAQSLALQAAQEGIVLLKNDGFLPAAISKSQTVAMIGFWANATTSMQGDYAGPAPYYRKSRIPYSNRGKVFTVGHCLYCTYRSIDRNSCLCQRDTLSEKRCESHYTNESTVISNISCRPCCG